MCRKGASWLSLSSTPNAFCTDDWRSKARASFLRLYFFKWINEPYWGWTEHSFQSIQAWYAYKCLIFNWCLGIQIYYAPMHYGRIDLSFCILMLNLWGRIFLLCLGLSCQRFWKFYYGWIVGAPVQELHMPWCLQSGVLLHSVLCCCCLLSLLSVAADIHPDLGFVDICCGQVIVILLWIQGNSNK